MTNQEIAVWSRSHVYFSELAARRAGEGLGIQLACLVLADYCIYEWSGDRGGPTTAMIQLAESIVGDRLDRVFANFEAEVNATVPNISSPKGKSS